MTDHDLTVPVLPTDSNEREEIPLFDGCLNYFPLALAAVARWSKVGNDKHNPGQPLGWTRDKSTDHENKIARHLLDVDTVAPSGEYEDAVALAWRALAKLQTLEEKRLGRPMSRASRVSAPPVAAPTAKPTAFGFLEKLKALKIDGPPPAPPIPPGWHPIKFLTGDVCDDPGCDAPAHFGSGTPNPAYHPTRRHP